MIEQQTIQANQKLETANPFPGLRPFNPDESLLFFGRDGLSDMLLEKLRLTRFVAVVGSSGSGKSSLVRAGLLPALRGGFMFGVGSGWRVALFRPINNPIRNLADALYNCEMFPSSGPSDASERLRLIEETLRRSSLGLIEVVRLASMQRFESLLIIADQFEELYRFEPTSDVENPKEEASAFVKLLLEATRQTDIPIYVILTMRSDYMGESAHFWGLPEAINRGQFLIPRMDDDERREAIEGPLRVRGAKISWPLVNRLLNDAGEDPRQLPILQHALTRTWDYWETHRSNSEPISIDDYDNLDVGRMDQALSIHADEAYKDLTDEQKIIAEKMFKRLTEKAAGKREGRLPATVSEIAQIAAVGEDEILPVIDAFRKEGRSFLMPPPSTTLTSKTLIDISHESLISGWARLSGWVEEEADSAKIYQRLVDDALRYPCETALLTNPELEFAQKWRAKEQPNEVWANRYRSEFGKALDGDNPPERPAWAHSDDSEFDIASRYLDLSTEKNDEVEGLKESKRRRKLIFLGVTAAIFLALFLVAFVYSGIVRNARSNAVAAQQQAIEGERKAAALQREAEALREAADQERLRVYAAYEVAEDQRQKAEQSALEAQKSRAQAEAAKRGFEVQAKLGNLLEEGISSAINGDVKTAIARFEDVQRINPDRSKRALNRVLIGDIILKTEDDLENKIDSEDALKYYKEALKLTQTGNAKLDASLFVRIGDNISKSSLGDTEAIPYYKYAVETMNAEKDRGSKLNTLIKLGQVEEFGQSVLHYEQALTLSTDPTTSVKIYMNLGEAYRKARKLKEAEVAFSKAGDIAHQSGNAVAEGNAFLRIGDMYREDKFDPAVEFYAAAHSAYGIDKTKSPTLEALLADARALDLLAQAERPNDLQASIKHYELALRRYRAALRTPGNNPEEDRIRLQKARVAIERVEYQVEYLKPFVISEILLKTIQANGVASGIKQYEDLKKNHANKYVFKETSLNRLGYDLLRRSRVFDAIEIFKLNVNSYPEGWNTYDSLAEGYLIAGNKDLAILNYEKALRLNPKATSAIEALKKLKGQ